ncbi:hypothetical protein PENSPDRAFT_749496 [Peniophora sp. CONT]|nr:hypothetical protein PENSPDRAFT_749496 [Peniophora sp. CONT]
MVNYEDPAVLAADYLAVIKLHHAFCGLYIWEWAKNLGYEWEVYTGKRPFRWTFPLYLACRYSILGAVINLIIGFNATHPIHCLVWVKFEFLLPYLGVVTASLLIALRAAAIWDFHPAMLTLAGASLLAQLALLIHSVTIATASWATKMQGCVLKDSVHASLPLLSATFAVDAVLLSLMLVGLMRRREARKFGMWRFLVKQGLVWLAVATVAELPTVVLLALNLNDALNLLFQTPEMIILAIAATNMYRSLSDFLHVDGSNLPGSDGVVDFTRSSGSASTSTHNRRASRSLSMHPSHDGKVHSVQIFRIGPEPIYESELEGRMGPSDKV